MEELKNIGGVKCHIPMSKNPVARDHSPKIKDAWCEEKKFCKQDETDPEKNIFFRYIDSGIVIESYGDKVSFKRSKGGRFKDLRDGKTYSREETLAELSRMLGDIYEGERAMTMLEFG